jgi:hypothetical protein
VNAILLNARGDEVEKRTVAPRRVRLTRAAVDRLAELTGVPSPVAPMPVPAGGAPAGLVGRLGDDVPAPAAPVDDLDEALVAATLLADGVPTEEGRAVLTVWHAPALAVDLEVLVRLRRGTVRVRSWHRNLDDWVVCLSTGDGLAFELAWLAAEDWWLELGRAAHVDAATLRGSEYAAPLPAVVETPWELLLATGEAVRRHRTELLDAMVAGHTGTTLAGDPADALETAADADVRLWHEQLEADSRGRLHAAVMGRGRRGRPGVGIVEWVLLGDGWRSLTPVTRDGWTMVRIERRSVVDLPRELAVRAAEVTS